MTSWFSLAYLYWYQLVQSGVPVLVPVGSVWRACLGTGLVQSGVPVLVPFGSVWRVLIVTSWFSLAYLSGYQLVQSGMLVLVPIGSV